MKIAIAGGTGFIGKHLVQYFTQKQAEVILISRSKNTSDSRHTSSLTWNELDQNIDQLEGLDALINLSGETINQYWTVAAKQRILQSRLETTARVAHIADQLQRKPKVVINGSGMSIYGTSETDSYDENSVHCIADFLSGVVDQWENAADQINGARVVKLRIGIVLGSDGGALPKMILPYKLGVGGRVGSGKQWLSWIHIEDMVRLIEFCIKNDEIDGPVNATASHPVTNDQFGRAAAKTLHKPHWFRVPAFVFKTIFGELSELLLKGQKVLPRKLTDHGFVFKYPGIEEALKDLIAPKRKIPPAAGG